MTVLVKMTSLTKEIGEKPNTEDTVRVLVISEPVDMVRDTIELAVALEAVKIPTCADNEEVVGRRSGSVDS